MKTVGIVQARMTSTRLPGKILKTVLGKPLLEYELERLKRVDSLDELIVATTTNIDDDPVVDLCRSMGVATYRGSEHDVLSRYYEAASERNADAVVRFTADCPLIDPEIAETVICHYLDHVDELDYCSTDVTTYPRGLDTEIFSMHALKVAFEQGHEKPDREHVTYYIHTRPEKFRIWKQQSGFDWAKYRLTVDTPEDFVLIKEIIERLYPMSDKFGLEDVIRLLESAPELRNINADIRQKEI